MSHAASGSGPTLAAGLNAAEVGAFERDRLLVPDPFVDSRMRGGVTRHSYRTPHDTPPNRSAHRPRRARIFNIATRSGRKRISGSPRHTR